MIYDPLQYLRAIADTAKDSNNSSSSSVTWAHILLASLRVAMEKSIDGNDHDLPLRKLHDELREALQRTQLDSCLPSSLSDNDLVAAVRELAAYEAKRPSLSEPQDRFLRWLSDCPTNLDDWTKSTWLQLLNEHHVKAAYFERQKASSNSLLNNVERENGGTLNPPSDRRNKSSVRSLHWLPIIIVVAGLFLASIIFTWQNGKQIKESADNAMTAAVSELKIALGKLGEVPIGGITMFYGKEDELPENYRIANGQRVNDPESSYHGKILPNLEGRFIRGALSDEDIAQEGGQDTTSFHRHHIDVDNWKSASILCLTSGRDRISELLDRNEWDGICIKDWAVFFNPNGNSHSAVVSRNFGNFDLVALVREGSNKLDRRWTGNDHTLITHRDNRITHRDNRPRFMSFYYIIRIK